MSKSDSFFTKLPKVTTSTQMSSTYEVLVIGLLQGEEAPILVIGENLLDDREADQIDAALASVGATGEQGEIWRLPSPAGFPVASVLAVGLGAGPKAENNESVRKAAGVAARYLEGVSSVITTLGDIDMQAAAEGFLLGAYSFSRFFTQKEKTKTPLGQVAFLVSENSEKTVKETLKKAAIIAESVAMARDFINTPSNYLFPESYAKLVASEAEKYGLTTEILDKPALEKGKYGGILAVGHGADHDPRLVRISYKPKGKKLKKVALVGKGITFDSGGLSLKPPKSMETMTCDMGGSAVMIASIFAAARLKLPIAVTATIPMAENMPSARATRPGDVITHYNGLTSEVLNTDAEGRIVLGDAISRAVEDKPDYLMEASTLTGAQVVALGSRIFGVMGDDEFRNKVVSIATEAGEKAWGMPLPEELKADLSSRVADVANISSVPEAGMLIAGLYLQHFVPQSLPWVHMDIAGPAFNTRGASGYYPKGGTGIPVRSIVAVLADLAHEK